MGSEGFLKNRCLYLHVPVIARIRGHELERGGTQEKLEQEGEGGGNDTNIGHIYMKYSEKRKFEKWTPKQTTVSQSEVPW